MIIFNNHDIFAIPHEDGYLIYLPIASSVIHANRECARQLREYFETGDPETVDREIKKLLGGLECLHMQTPPVPLPLDRQFHPTSVTLFLTNRCNLNCSYCYARANEFKANKMAPQIYKTAIDLIIRNAKRAGHQPGVGFHGGGEPTMAWDLLTGAVNYARKKAMEFGSGVHFGIATNGVMNKKQAEFVADVFPVVTLSLDGPEGIQNLQRPKIGGEGSFQDVMAFVDILQKHGTPYVIRSTITGNNVHVMKEMVEFFAKNTECRQLHFEPAFSSGRCLGMLRGIPETETFADHFISALDCAREHKMQLRFSAARLMGNYLSFCGLSQDAFNVTPTGDLTSCFEISEQSDPLASTFFYGSYDNIQNKFDLNMDRLAHLRNLNVTKNSYCQKCFAKWNCAGDCPIKRIQPGQCTGDDTLRCDMIRRITKALLVSRIDEG